MTKYGMLALLAIIAVFAVVTTVFFIDDASANPGVEYAYHVGDEAIFLPNCIVPGKPACPAVAEADNGDTIEIISDGNGTLSKPGEATGSGTFTHNFSGGGSVSGTWEATELLSFRPFGPNVSAFDQKLQSGEAHIRVALFVDGTQVDTGTLSIGCLLGPPRSYPRGAFEGVRLNLDSGPNFNINHLGATIFIRQHPAH